jgi:twinkle protein
MTDKTPSNFVAHIPCENQKCGSTDANSLYDDGHQYCFACETHVQGDGSANVPEQTRKQTAGLISGEFRDMIKRKLHEATCRKFGYQIGTFNGKSVQIAPYFDKDGVMVAQKIRFPDKTFMVLGDLKNALPFGAPLWHGGKKIVVCEGEIDALTVAQVQNLKWPVVSIPTGAKGAKKSISKNLEYFNAFEEVVFMFDMDDPGRDAAIECAELFAPGKAKIATLPLKDPNECLLAGKDQEIITAIWNAKGYRPDGLVSVEDLMAELDKPIEQGLPWFLEELTALTYGRRYGEVYGFGAGTGIGKTDFLTQQIDYDISTLGQKVGLIFLEQKPIETVVRVAGKHAGKRFHVPDGSWTAEERRAEVEKLKGQVVLYDSFGQTDWEVIANKIRFMAVSEGIKLFYLDHLTAMADTADERGSLEQIMKEMAGLANELQIIIHFVSHLTTPEGKPHEEGGQVSIRHFKGSRAIGFWSYFMFGLERNQQAADPVLRSITTLRILKDRYTGQATGHLLYLGYDPTTGRLFQTTMPESTHGFKDETNSEF